jgi:glutamate-1-semialdehyde aminotransferase
MFRDVYIWNYRTETFMADDRSNYFALHPDRTLTCATCVDQTCRCPQGLSVPTELARVHTRARALVDAELHPGPPQRFHERTWEGPHRILVLTSESPSELDAGRTGVARFFVENAGTEMWTAFSHLPDTNVAVAIGVTVDRRLVAKVPIRQNVSAGQRSHLVVEFSGPRRPGRYNVRLFLMPLAAPSVKRGSTLFHETTLTVVGSGPPTPPRVRRVLRATWRALADGRRMIGPSANPVRYGARYVEHTIPATMVAGSTYGMRLTLENTGSFAWDAQPSDGHPVEVVVFIDDRVYSVLKLPRDCVAPGGQVTLHFALRAPSGQGPHAIRVDVVHQQVAWLSDRGSPALTLGVDVRSVPATTTSRALQLSLDHNLWHYQPTQGIALSRDGHPFPLFVSRAKGCRVWDPEGHEYLDYTMSWGATILGHADDRVQGAIRDLLDVGPLPPFPHPLEMEVSRMVVEDFPGAEMVAFGKNGSDVCTVAARLARLTTGKRVILSCGFHGWQDFGLDYFGFADSGIPKGPERALYKFRFNDKEDFFQLYNRHKNNLAAVMIEPSGPAGGPDEGLGPDTDVEFLHAIAEAAKRANALLVFDEIITGYRYPRGSVQRATGIVPDLTCLGKALASGMPLSAVLGPRRIFFDAFFKTHYCPTFKGEIYSFAAAHAAIPIYRREPVAEHIWKYGEDLKAGIDAICRQLGIDAESKGPPFRQGVFFNGRDPETRQLKRTLYTQELLKAGIITVTGIMLPSYAHDREVLSRTLSAVGSALDVVATAERHGDYHRYLEIPLL